MRTPAMPNPKADREADRAAKAIGAALLEARKASGLSREKLATSAALQRDTVLRVEKGDASVSLRNIVRLCRALGLDAREVVGGK